MPEKKPPETEEERKRLREGFTTGACAAAAAKAATRVLIKNALIHEIETTLPNRSKVTFALKRCEQVDKKAICSVIKDAGDDPDCTHNAELVAEVELTLEPTIELRGGQGVAVVTKPGLGLEVGGPAINPVPRKNITEMVKEELKDTAYGAVVTIHVPGGEEMAKKTLNARLGLIGGISILGTTGIVKPYSTSSWKASIVQAIDVAAYRGSPEVVLTTGGRTEDAAMKLFPKLSEDVFIQMGDFVGNSIAHAARKKLKRVIIVGMMGKLSKIAEGVMYTHARQGEVNMKFLAGLAGEVGATPELQDLITKANTARHVLDLCKEQGVNEITSIICRKATEAMSAHVNNELEVWTYLVDFEGGLLGHYPESAPTGGSVIVREITGRDMTETTVNDMRQMTGLGRKIEDESFSIIDREVGPHNFSDDQWQVTRRVIHATADFEFKELMKFHPDAIKSGITALKSGCPVLVDVKMIAVGLNEDRLSAYGCQIYSYISDADVIAEAKAKNSTRAIEAMRKAHKLGKVDGAVIAIGNAPTALLELKRLAEEENAKPALVIGVPVGFVSAAESKEAIVNFGKIPYIIASGRKGGSTIAVAIIHALLLLSVEEKSK